MKVQYNFKIEDELKQELEQELEQSSINNKEDFINELLQSYKQCQANNTDYDIDLSKYESVSRQTKEIITEAFKHILKNIEANTSNNRQIIISLEQEKKTVSEKKEEFDIKLKELENENNRKILELENKFKKELEIKDKLLETYKKETTEAEENKQIVIKQLSDAQKELQQTQSIATQVQSITEANKELREELRANEEKHKKDIEELKREIENKSTKLQELHENNFKADFLSEQQRKKIKELEERLTDFKKIEVENIQLKTKLEILVEKKEEGKGQI